MLRQREGTRSKEPTGRHAKSPSGALEPDGIFRLFRIRRHAVGLDTTRRPRAASVPIPTMRASPCAQPPAPRPIRSRPTRVPGSCALSPNALSAHAKRSCKSAQPCIPHSCSRLKHDKFPCAPAPTHPNAHPIPFANPIVVKNNVESASIGHSRPYGLTSSHRIVNGYLSYVVF